MTKTMPPPPTTTATVKVEQETPEINAPVPEPAKMAKVERTEEVMMPEISATPEPAKMVTMERTEGEMMSDISAPPPVSAPSPEHEPAEMAGMEETEGTMVSDISAPASEPETAKMARTEETMMSDISATPPETAKMARMERTERRMAAAEEPPLFDLNLTVEENLHHKVDWYEVRYAEMLKENAGLRKELAEANRLLRRGNDELTDVDDGRRNRKRMREDMHGGQVHRRSRSSAPPPPERRRRQYSPRPQRQQYCEICRMKNHSTEDCRVRTGACFGCGEVGHRKYECPWMKNLRKRRHQSPGPENVPKRDGEPSPRQREEKM